VGVVLTPLPGGKEVVWYSERSGWAHLYLYDLETGILKNAITQGDWLVRNILHIDIERRELIIQTAGRVAGRNPYYRDICRVNIDSGSLTPLLSTDHEYVVCDHQARLTTGHKGVSPSGQFIVTTVSRVDERPASLLLDREGHSVLELEEADVSNLPAGWQWPEPVKLTAADGETDIYGVVFRPTDFSAERSYPILDFSSMGEYMPMGSFGNDLGGGMYYLTPATYAELGFIVVAVLGRGTGLRSKAFQTDKDTPHFNGSHQDDCIAGIQQLAKIYPYMDVNRVGLGGYRSPASTLTGMLLYPDFYKVGISSNTFADLRICGEFFGENASGGQYEAERFQELHALENYAKNLKGKLLLTHAMLDNAAPVAVTFRMVEALQKANKDFDMLLMPNGMHGTHLYITRRSWDYFVEHLLGVKPPKEFSLSECLDATDATQYTYKAVLDPD